MLIYLLAFLALLIILLKILNWNDYGKFRLPPKVPWALPLLGHLLALGDSPYKVLSDWAQIYGPVLLVKFGSFRTVVFNDANSIQQVFKLTEVHDRPPFNEYKYAIKNQGIGFLEYGIHHAEQRQFVLQSLKRFNKAGLTVEAATNYELTWLLDSLALKNDQPVQVVHLFTTTIINSIWATIMGHKLKHDDPETVRFIEMVERLSTTNGVIKSMSMFMPWMYNWVPNLTGVPSWVEAYENIGEFIEVKAAEKDKSRVKDHPRDIVDAYLMEVENTTNPDSSFFGPKKFMRQTLGELLVASGEVTSVGLEWAILLMARYDHVQKQLQQEIAQVVSTSRIPYLSDRQNMPYTEAVIAEITRFSAFAPMSLPHYTRSDLEVCGYFIPKDTMILQNTYAVFHDPAIWGDPDKFRPERFLDENGKYRPNYISLIFGSGKRKCIGDTIARDQLFVAITRIFQRFTVRNGPVAPSLKCIFGVAMHPVNFEVVFSERI